jgi:hypothetical protein
MPFFSDQYLDINQFFCFFTVFVQSLAADIFIHATL